ncbi:MAG: hypothetical protein QF832_00510 [SAR324 cluster bacterium]|jgi:hypothetical protein|nr:hypothetical protein [SAR324 cluster bacterium]
MFSEFDLDVQYNGPKSDFATFTGSPIWGYSVDNVIAIAKDRGWDVQSNERFPTPYGLGPLVNHFVTPTGRDVIWIPSYGEVVGEDSLYHYNFEKAFWILWKAGVKILLVGGTSGIADWRGQSKSLRDKAISPGDVVLPWSFYTRPVHRGLPCTDFESMWSKSHLLLGDPFCPDGQKTLLSKFTPFLDQGKIRKIHTPSEVRAALVVPNSITFETEFDIVHWLSIGKTASDLQPHLPPVATVHGDCLNPILARYLGIHLFYYHLISNYAQGLVPQEETAKSIHKLYSETYPTIATEIEFDLLENLSIPTGESCKCTSSLHKAPSVFSQSLTQPAG